jgi:hypothetical protein
MTYFLERGKHLRPTIALFGMLALLAGQGLRLCLHSDDVEPMLGGLAHLESNMLQSGEPDDLSDQHLSLGLALVKQVVAGLFAVLGVVALIWLLPETLRNFGAIPRYSLPQSLEYHFRPPLRAPPL